MTNFTDIDIDSAICLTRESSRGCKYYVWAAVTSYDAGEAPSYDSPGDGGYIEANACNTLGHVVELSDDDLAEIRDIHEASFDEH